jgi:hypothetical protein
MEEDARILRPTDAAAKKELFRDSTTCPQARAAIHQSRPKVKRITRS